MNMMPFYKLHSWIIREFGFSREMAAYMLIYSFYENGLPCVLSKSQFAEFLQCDRRQAIRTLNELTEAGYIAAELHKREDGNDFLKTEYHIIESKALEMQESENEASAEECTRGSGKNVTRGSDKITTRGSGKNVTRGSGKNVTSTIIENKKENKKREGERESGAAAPPHPPTRSRYELTEEQERTLRSYDYSAVKGHRQPEHYIRLAEKYGFDMALSFLLEDGGRERRRSESTIDLELAERIMNGLEEFAV